MGAAAAQRVAALGGEVVVMDRAPVEYPVDQAIELDLADPSSIDDALGKIDGPIDALFSAAGIADGPPLMRINFIGHRHLIDRLLAADLLPRGSAIGFISSAAGLGWEGSLTELREYLALTDFDAATKWAVDNGKADYMWSKKAICAYVSAEAFELLKRGIRINAILPGPTDTPLAQANKELWLGFGADYRAEAGIEASTPLEQAYPLVFLCSDAAAGVTGITMITDAGYFAAGVTGSFPDAEPVIGFLRSV
jgi:NAD(P)-dependent dehydrogenase (short-subunit alcohol dehydrogenase family)